jgi:endonuclease III
MSSETAKILEKCTVIRGQVELFIEQTKRKDARCDCDEPINKCDEDELINKSSLALIIATICDQRIRSDIAWKIPCALYEWLRGQGLDFRASVIYKHVGEERLREWFRDYMVHKWPKLMKKESREEWLKDIPRYIIKSCEKISEEYDDDPDSIFIAGGEQLSIPHIYLMLRQFPGIGPKKASMIARDFGSGSCQLICLIERLKGRGVNLKVTHTYFTEMPVDVHVRRVFKRLGFSRYGSPQDFQNLARIIYPENPGLVDLFIWNLGREVCKRDKPKCQECPLNNICDEYSTQLRKHYMT